MYKPQLSLSSSQVQTLRSSWNQMIVDDISSNVSSSIFCRQFYSNLLSMKPDLEKHFPSIKHQAVSFAGVMSFAIQHLEKISVLDDYLLNLGKRHSRILGIEPLHFEIMGQALIRTFNERFGDLFTSELENLWILLYVYLSNSLLQFGIDPVLKLNSNIFNHNVIEPDHQQLLQDDNLLKPMTSIQTIQLNEKEQNDLDSTSNSSSLSLVNDQNRSSISTLNTVISRFNATKPDPNVTNNKSFFHNSLVKEQNQIPPVPISKITVDKDIINKNMERVETRTLEKGAPLATETVTANEKFDFKKIKKIRKRDNCVIM